MVIIFVLMIFIVAQFYLTQLLSGRDKDLARLQGQIHELGELLSLEKTANLELQTNIQQLTLSLESSTSERDALRNKVDELVRTGVFLQKQLDAAAARESALNTRTDELQQDLTSANETINITQSELTRSLQQLQTLKKELMAKTKENEASSAQLEQSKSLRKQLKEDLDEARHLLNEIIVKLSKEKFKLVAAKALNTRLRSEYGVSSRRLNDQILALRREIATLNETLKESERQNELKNVKIIDLGRKLNRALASKVQELARFRSEFFGKLKDVLKNRKDIRIVGDRFVFQSEVLFASGAADIGSVGKLELTKFANTLNSIAPDIPQNIDWILQVEGHTDHIPIYNNKYQSNWDLSAARAISVVEFLVKRGVKPSRLSAAGYGEFQPLDNRRDEISNRRNRRIEMKLTQR
ncbi:MAG: hypothetical protein CMM58_10465 [Rhodospirillaceae bacterium]|nr:hypothetical protein [Rhodospirillaceae bacterium]